ADVAERTRTVGTCGDGRAAKPRAAATGYRRIAAGDSRGSAGSFSYLFESAFDDAIRFAADAARARNQRGWLGDAVRAGGGVCDESFLGLAGSVPLEREHCRQHQGKR